MNKKQVLTLSSIAIILGGTLLIVKQTQKDSGPAAVTSRAAGETLFASFPATEIANVEISGADGSVTIVKKDGKWTLAQRENYPANAVMVNEFIRTLAELKVTRSLEAAPSFAPRFGMDEASTNPEERGLTATFKDANGKELAKMSLGKNIEGSQEASPMGAMPVGRYVRNHADESGFYAVNEMFFSISADLTRWFAEEFITPTRIKSVTLSKKGFDSLAWKLSRDEETAEFKLDGLKSGEELSSENVTPIKNLFSYARFEDVVSAAAAAERGDATGKRNATIETFDGFTYQLTITPLKPGASPASSAPDNQLVTIAVSANYPTERKKDEGETPEDAKTKDEAFAAQLKTLNEKLAKEQSFAGRHFEVSKTTLDALIKERETLVKKSEPAAASTPAAKGVEAVTKPVQAPAAKSSSKKPTKKANR
ncbi:MAG: hypothetical protein RLZ22_1396 [Verrucomicrobiota bacterium]|jgi:hypothetical protein